MSETHRTITYSRRYSWPNERSGDGTDSTIENNAADLAALLRRLGVMPVHLVGHSYGGFVAAYFAAVHSDVVRTLTPLSR
ncbi:MAG: alpha/beta fold hydrolase [Thermoplasmata archaeon]